MIIAIIMIIILSVILFQNIATSAPLKTSSSISTIPTPKIPTTTQSVTTTTKPLTWVDKGCWNENSNTATNNSIRAITPFGYYIDLRNTTNNNIYLPNGTLVSITKPSNLPLINTTSTITDAQHNIIMDWAKSIAIQYGFDIIAFQYNFELYLGKQGSTYNLSNGTSFTSDYTKYGRSTTTCAIRGGGYKLHVWKLE
jgi:hypothetical protein